MRTFALSTPLATWFNAILAAPPDTSVGPLPPPPTDTEELAFYNNFLVPLAQVKAEVVSLVPPPAPNPYALGASGQPLYPESWGAQSGAP